MLRTSVSCPFQCAFCSYPTRTQKYECLSVDHVERQLDQLEKTHHTHMVNFVDDTFNVPKARFKTLLEMMIHKRYSFQWHAFIRAQYLDEETVSLMKQSNCKAVLLDLESGNRGRLDRMNKKVMLEQLEHGILLLKKYSILTIGLFIVASPGKRRIRFRTLLRLSNGLNLIFILLSRGSIIETLRFINSVRYMG